MERRICVRVAVSDEAHAGKIHEDIVRAIKHRTTIYHVGYPHKHKVTIDQIGENTATARGLDVLIPDEV